MFWRSLTKCFLFSATLALCFPAFAGDDYKSYFDSRLTSDFAIPRTMDIKLLALAGKEAVNCGRVHLGQDPQLPTNCAQKSFAANKAFYVRYDREGIDTENATGFSFNGNLRKLYKVEYLHQLGGAGPRERLTLVPCSSPIKVNVNKNGLLTCSLDYFHSESEIVYPLKQYN
jgi:hypothetical protein